ncbi:hypothetical protein [Arenibacter sp. F26102]|uniref:hypothetical protein n=1 Tax=Arenibacter sp. F26102 TaxID=2926416 RepID=UPI001FF69706|nr:hypothetical protein [Arenibacter sp. F26102]
MPCITSIIRCPSNDNGLALVPDFHSMDAIANYEIKLIWKGNTPVIEFIHYDVDGNIVNKETISR